MLVIYFSAAKFGIACIITTSGGATRSVTTIEAKETFASSKFSKKLPEKFDKYYIYISIFQKGYYFQHSAFESFPNAPNQYQDF